MALMITACSLSGIGNMLGDEAGTVLGVGAEHAGDEAGAEPRLLFVGRTVRNPSWRGPRRARARASCGCDSWTDPIHQPLGRGESVLRLRRSLLGAVIGIGGRMVRKRSIVTSMGGATEASRGRRRRGAVCAAGGDRVVGPRFAAPAIESRLAPAPAIAARDCSPDTLFCAAPGSVNPRTPKQASASRRGYACHQLPSPGPRSADDYSDMVNAHGTSRPAGRHVSFRRFVAF